jgi:membrane-bound lytic murein transglycosylase D
MQRTAVVSVVVFLFLLFPLIILKQAAASFITSSDESPSPSKDERPVSVNESETGLFGETSVDGPSSVFNPSDENLPEPDEEAFFDETDYDVPIVMNESVEDYLNYFQTSIRDRFALWLARSGRYLPLMRETFKKYGLPEDLVYVALIESGFNPYAYSRARATGPWQFMKGTARLYQLQMNLWVDERRDPIKSTDAAARHLKDLYARFGSWPLALASYNAGENKIHRALVKANTDDYWDLRSSRHIRRETKGYVPKFMAATIIAKNPERFGFSLQYHDLFIFDQVQVPGSASLRAIAKAAEIAYDDLKELNPELRTEITPPYASEYTLRLPAGKSGIFETNYAQMPDEEKLAYTRYTVRRNDTLSTIAKRFGTTADRLAEFNHRSSDKPLQVGEAVFIPKLKTVPPAVKRQVVASVPISRQIQTGTNGSGQRQILYRVQPGDTLWDIGQSFDIRLDDLRRYNGLSRASLIRPGDLLILGYEPILE